MRTKWTESDLNAEKNEKKQNEKTKIENDVCGFKPFAWASALADDMLLFQKFSRHPKTRISLMRSFMLFSTLVSVKLTHGII